MIKKYFKTPTDRTQRANVNTILSLFFRGGSILLQFALVPLTIHYIKPDAYGLWLTLSSLVGWVAMFDIGIGNGLKNKLSESLAVHDFEKAKMFVSTTYMVITLIACVLIALYFMCYQLVNWQVVFNSNFIEEAELKKVVTIVSLFFLLKFITDIINVVASSFQMVAISSILLFISNLGLVLSVWILTKSTKSDLVLLAFFLSAIPFLISLLANFYLFNRYFKMVKPSLQSIDFKKSKDIMSLGSKFFILQIISLIIFQTDNILIAQLFTPGDVTNFNVAYKYYSIVTILFTIILTPYWTAFTEAYHIRDYSWIKEGMAKLYRYWYLSIILLVVMLFFSGFVIKLWVGNQINISLNLSIAICCYVAIFNWNAIFSIFINGVGKIRLQILVAPLAGLLNIPMSIFFVKVLNWGTYAMPASNFICLILGAIFGYIQYCKIINNNAKGIWNK
ncbi:MAG TPA: oligosaccharide flippase family protein [Flavobacterium sp.]